MTPVSKPFNKYKVYYYSNEAEDGWQAYIDCYNDSKYVGRLAFYKDAYSLPANGFSSPYGTPEPCFNFKLSRFNDVINLLREEKPLSLWFYEERKTGIIGTGDFEPVGEEESR